jgi:ATP-dependent Clp protease ATP-binding subunit ClpA
MFERYTERARRVIFFARFEASQSGSMTIESEHLLLGLLREDSNMSRHLQQPVPAKDIKTLVEARLAKREKVSTSIDLPLSAECRHILGYAAEEAEGLDHHHIGTEHLLLGTLREDTCGAAQVLKEVGFDLETVRQRLRDSKTTQGSDKGIRDSDSEGRRQLQQLLASEFQLDEAAPRIVVPDAETAERVAVAAWTLHFDAATIDNQRPFHVEQRFTVWIISGSAPAEAALFAFISRKSGRVLAIGQGEPEF